VLGGGVKISLIAADTVLTHCRLYVLFCTRHPVCLIDHFVFLFITVITVNKGLTRCRPNGRNRIGPPCSVGRRPSMRPAGPHAGSVTDDANRRQRAKQYWPIRRASNNNKRRPRCPGFSVGHLMTWVASSTRTRIETT